MQESICADAASFDLLPTSLTSCIAEAQECIQLCSFKRSIENSADKQFDPENYAILKGYLKFSHHLPFNFMIVKVSFFSCL
jgi:regulator of telomere elongation helicase 1